MLELMARYAYMHNCTVEPGFKPKIVRWLIVLDSNTGFVSIEDLGAQEQKRNMGRIFPRCPDLSQGELIGGNLARSHFLAETVKVVSLYGATDKDTRTNEKHQYFINMLDEAGEIVPQFARVAWFLKKGDTINKIQSALIEKKAKTTDRVTFQIDGKCPLDMDDWHTWWRSYRNSLKSKLLNTNENNLRMRCLASGEMAIPLKTHPKIEGLAGVGGQTSGDVLIGFDKEAYCSYGLRQSTNAAVSEAYAYAYRSGLNEIIRKQSRVLPNIGVAHWYKDKIVVTDDPLEWLLECGGQRELRAQNSASELLQSTRQRKRSDLARNYFYAMTVSGANGRVMVRDWIEGPTDKLLENVVLWFSDMEIVHWHGDFLARNPRFISVLGSMAGNFKDLPAPLTTKIWQAAVQNEVIPFSALTRVLARRKIEILSEAQTINTSGIGLIKAYHIRKYRKEGNSRMIENMQPVLNEEFPNPAYHCGRLMAVLADLQRAALGEPGARGVVQRYYAVASAKPASTLGYLTRVNQANLNKLPPGLAYWYENKMADIWIRLREPLPHILTLEDQSLFAMGYYQQLAFIRNKEFRNKEEKKEIANG